MKKQKKKTKEKTKDQKMVDWISDYFCDVILPTCHISGYKVYTEINRDGEDDKTFSIEVRFPYRSIVLYIRKGGIKYYEKKDFQAIREALFHEAFHIIHWKYKEYAESRYIDAATLKELEEDVADRFSVIVEALYQKVKKSK